jgi:glycine/D-amino acid oxidase-like deaminating enzyme
LVASGEDREIDFPSYRARGIERKSARIASKVEELIPGLKFEPIYMWTGTFGESVDGLPLIDAIPDMPGCFAVMGFGGNGTVYSLIASQIVPTLPSRSRCAPISL